MLKGAISKHSHLQKDLCIHSFDLETCTSVSPNNCASSNLKVEPSRFPFQSGPETDLYQFSIVLFSVFCAIFKVSCLPIWCDELSTHATTRPYGQISIPWCSQKQFFSNAGISLHHRRDLGLRYSTTNHYMVDSPSAKWLPRLCEVAATSIIFEGTNYQKSTRKLQLDLNLIRFSVSYLNPALVQNLVQILNSYALECKDRFGV